MTTRRIKIAGTSITVEVPVYITDWVDYVAVDEDGSVWMYEQAPTAGASTWQVSDGDYDALPSPSSGRPFEVRDMHGLDWRTTLTAVGDA